MIYGVIAIVAASLGILYSLMGSFRRNRIVEVSVTKIVDGKTVEAREESGTRRVVLAGIGFPPRDERAERDALELLDDIASGRRFQMGVIKEVEGVLYVELKTAIGESLNGLLLERGFARYESRAIGIVRPLFEAEIKAKEEKRGIWNQNRALFRQASDSYVEGAFDGDARTIDQIGDLP